jgi:methylmalonyl-CoA mutase
MTNKGKKLFENFAPITEQEWKEKATIDLKGADFDRKLVWKNLSQIKFQPFYNTEDNKTFLSNTGQNTQSLVNYRRIIVQSEKSANKLALKAIEEGITGLLFDLKENVSAYGLLEGIDLSKTTVSFILRDKETEFASDFFALANENNVDFNNLKGYFDLDIMHNYVTSGKVDCNQFDKVTELVKLAENHPNYKAISISGGVYLDSGANQVQEVAYTLNSLVFLIEKYTNRNIELQTIFDNLHFELAIGSEYFIEIGKFRAFNNLLHEISKKYGIQEFSYNLTAKTSIWSKSITDANTNMLRATTEAMSAILGNVDGVEIDPYDKEFDDQSDFSSRIAGNIATILKEEAYFGKVSNPVDGSYYIEKVSSKIAEKALELFKIIENNGGYYRAFESERIQKQIAEIRFEKIRMLSQRKLVMVGVNKYPNLMETVESDILSDFKMATKSINKELKPRRAALEIEALRRNTEECVAKTKHRPIVELASYGNLGMRKARAAFAYDFMGISGFKVLDEQSHCCAEKAAEESAKSNSNIVVICSSDKDYTETAVDYVKTFRAINTDKVLLLAGNPSDIADELLKAGLDGFINIKSDVIDTISNVQNRIKKLVVS